MGGDDPLTPHYLSCNSINVTATCQMIWQKKKKKKKGTFILSKANVTKFNFVKLLNLDEGNDYSFYYSFNFL